MQGQAAQYQTPTFTQDQLLLPHPQLTIQLTPGVAGAQSAACLTQSCPVNASVTQQDVSQLQPTPETTTIKPTESPTTTTESSTTREAVIKVETEQPRLPPVQPEQARPQVSAPPQWPRRVDDRRPQVEPSRPPQPRLEVTLPPVETFVPPYHSDWRIPQHTIPDYRRRPPYEYPARVPTPSPAATVAQESAPRWLDGSAYPQQIRPSPVTRPAVLLQPTVAPHYPAGRAQLPRPTQYPPPPPPRHHHWRQHHRQHRPTISTHQRPLTQVPPRQRPRPQVWPTPQTVGYLSSAPPYYTPVSRPVEQISPVQQARLPSPTQRYHLPETSPETQRRPTPSHIASITVSKM